MTNRAHTIVELSSGELERARIAVLRESGKPDWWPSWLWKRPNTARVFDYCLRERGYMTYGS